MRIRLFIVIAMMTPIIFLFGLEIYLERYDVHTKYLSQLKDSFIQGKTDKGFDVEQVNSVIAGIDSGDFSKVGRCMRAGYVWGSCDMLESSSTKNGGGSNIDIINGVYKDSSVEDLQFFRDRILKKGFNLGNFLDFDREYDFLSDNDVDIWARFNIISGHRFGYFIDFERELPTVKSEIINVQRRGAFEPFIRYSNLTKNEVDRVRILAISDSFGDGVGLLSSDDTWASELEFQLNQIEDRYEVVSLARGGAGYMEFLSWVEGGYVEAIDPDIVLLSFYRNDFDFLHNFGGGNVKTEDLLNLDNELLFYLRCFEEEDNFFGKGLKKVNLLFPSVYRFYKFSSCSEDVSNYDKIGMSNGLEIVNTYKEMDRLIKVPFYLYPIESLLNLDKNKVGVLGSIEKNGLGFVTDKDDEPACWYIEKENCEEFNANKFDTHYNRYYSKMYIEGKIGYIKNKIDLAVSKSLDSAERSARINKSEAIIVDYLPNAFFVFNENRERSFAGLFVRENYVGGVRGSSYFCGPFDRNGVVLNFNRYLTKGKKIRISSEYQRSGLGLVSRGYDKEGKEVYGEAIELLPGKPVTFIGSESVRGIVVLSNNKNCRRAGIDDKDEFLLQFEII